MDLESIVSYTDTLLETEAYQDHSANGLQVENSGTVSKICLAVDACHEAITKTAAASGNLLVVHHGLFWGQQKRIVGNHFMRVRDLLASDIALYVSHLPLDAHPELGHNARIAAALGLGEIQPFAPLHGRPIGCRGTLPAVMSQEAAAEHLKKIIGCCSAFMTFGSRQIETVAVVAGSATDPELFQELSRKGVDLFVTGEPKHGAYYLAKEYKLNVFYGSHYYTETFGLKALGAHLQQRFSLATEFIDVPCLA